MRLPRTAGQVRQRVDGGWIRADRVHEGAGVRIELDGRLAHPGATTDCDVRRDDAVLLEHDDLTLRYRWSHVAGRPCDVARQVAHALTRAGRTTSPTRCPRCPCRTRTVLRRGHQVSGDVARTGWRVR